MLLYKTDGTSKINKYSDVVNARGNVDYVKGNVIYKNADMQTVLVSSQSDLPKLNGYDPGTIAFTAGFGNMWQKKPDGTWATFE